MDLWTRVAEVHGGTSGTDYVYFVVNSELVHVSQIRGAVKIREERQGGRRRFVVWSVPIDEVAGRRCILVSFSRRGRYPNIRELELPSDREKLVSMEIDPFTLSEARLVDVETLKRYRFRLFGGEREWVLRYQSMVPQLVSDIWITLRGIGVRDVYAFGHAERVYEALRDPQLALQLSLVIPTVQGRVRSLYEKVVHVYELWLLTQVAKVVRDLGAEPLADTLWILFTTNEPALVMRHSASGRYVYILYQPSIVPHIAGMLVGKRVHAVPDIAVLVSDKELSIKWGELQKYAELVALVIEAKLTLSGITVYESVDTLIEQVEAYWELLRHRPRIVVAIHDSAPSAIRRIAHLRNTKNIDIHAFDNVTPGSITTRSFMESVREALQQALTQSHQ